MTKTMKPPPGEIDMLTAHAVDAIKQSGIEVEVVDDDATHTTLRIHHAELDKLVRPFGSTAWQHIGPSSDAA